MSLELFIFLYDLCLRVFIYLFRGKIKKWKLYLYEPKNLPFNFGLKERAKLTKKGSFNYNSLVKNLSKNIGFYFSKF